jgi:large subunit ribosomal protein L27
MAHTKAAGSRANQGGNVAGKRLGVKKYGGEVVKAGMILVRQKGSKIIAGKNAFFAKNFSIHAKSDGVVTFRKGAGNKRGHKVLDVLPVESK